MEVKYNHLKSFEGFRSSLAKAGMIGALSLSPMDSKSIDRVSWGPSVGYDYINDDKSELKSQISKLSQIRKSECRDTTLNNILSEIESSVDSNDFEKYKKLLAKLSTHLDQKYQFKMEEKDVAKLNTNDIGSMSLILLIGWIGSLCLSICGIPQAWQSLKTKNSYGISWGFLLLWGFGELFGIVYVLDKNETPLIMNYAANILILGIIFYFKVNPKIDTKSTL